MEAKLLQKAILGRVNLVSKYISEGNLGSMVIHLEKTKCWFQEIMYFHPLRKLIGNREVRINLAFQLDIDVDDAAFSILTMLLKQSSILQKFIDTGDRFILEELDSSNFWSNYHSMLGSMSIKLNPTNFYVPIYKYGSALFYGKGAPKMYQIRKAKAARLALISIKKHC